MLTRYVSFALLLASSAFGSVYVTNPAQTTVCTVGQSCQVQWVENGESPLLSDIGECEVGLYTAEFQLAQTLPSVNVATTNSFTFQSNPSPLPPPLLGGKYYIAFSANSINYQGFSNAFTIIQPLAI